MANPRAQEAECRHPDHYLTRREVHGDVMACYCTGCGEEVFKSLDTMTETANARRARRDPDYLTDNGRPCDRCRSTCATYAVDRDALVIDVFCNACGVQGWMQLSPLVTLPTRAAECSAIHRNAEERWIHHAAH